VAAVEAHAARLLAAAGRPASAAPPPDYARLFCRNARNLRVVSYRSLAEETAPESCRSHALAAALAAGDESAGGAALYLLLRAADRFHATYGRYPGSFETGVEEDAAQLRALAAALASELGLPPSAALDAELPAEVCRYGAAELHVVASIMGGMAAQARRTHPPAAASRAAASAGGCCCRRGRSA
jgi:amyloid beta precursor protein binding protein 1